MTILICVFTYLLTLVKGNTVVAFSLEKGCSSQTSEYDVFEK